MIGCTEIGALLLQQATALDGKIHHFCSARLSQLGKNFADDAPNVSTQALSIRCHHER